MTAAGLLGMASMGGGGQSGPAHLMNSVRFPVSLAEPSLPMLILARVASVLSFSMAGPFSLNRTGCGLTTGFQSPLLNWS